VIVIYFFPISSGMILVCQVSSWSWSYGNWIYNYLCNQCLLHH